MTPDSASRPVPTDPPRSRQEWQAILDRSGIRPRRSMGQNFLVEPDVVRRIADVAGISTSDLVVEVGPGTGILTRELLSRGAEVVAVELDGALAAFLRRDIPDSGRLKVVEGDARYFDVEEHVGLRSYVVVANLPYSVATVIIRRFLDNPHRPDALHVMVQREVAERMTARPPDMSLLGLACQLDTEPAIAFTVPPDAFLPAPKVESAVVSMRVMAEPAVTRDKRDMLFRLATMAFQRRRKTLANGLSQGLDSPKGEVERYLREVDIDPMRRPETLAVEDWLRLATRMIR